MQTFVAPLLQSDSIGICAGMLENAPIAWLDLLLRGGFDGPDAQELGRPQVVLLAGPPGAGKSLLMQQICYNIARNSCHVELPADLAEAIQSGASLYLTTEASAAAIVGNLSSLGLTQIYSNDGHRCAFGVLPLPAAGHAHAPFPLMCVREIGNAGLALAPENEDALPQNEEGEPPHNLELILHAIQNMWLAEVQQRAHLGLSTPYLIAIDSLNVFPTMEAKRYLFEAVLQLFCHQGAPNQRPKYVFLVLEVTPSSYAESEYAYFEHISDVSIRLDHGYGASGYFTRSLEIKKNRFKSHALGRHVVKIYPKPDTNGEDLAIDPEGARPHIHSGGVFVFPSVHFILSSIRSGKPLIQCRPRFPSSVLWASKPDYARKEMAAWGPGPIAPLMDAEAAADTDIDWDSPLACLNWPTPWCYELVGGGVPLRQCTALVGNRGARKSYFGYQFLLDGIANGEQTLVVSFRDNPESVRATMSHIAQAAQYRNSRIADALRRKNPVVVYQRAGYVTPEELLHRIVTAVGEFQPTRLLISSVDQWEAGYPLLAGCSILVPALIDFLNSHGVTSMVVGVEGTRSSIAGTGLTAKSEVVLSFDHQTLRWPPRKRRRSGGPASDMMPRGVPLYCKPRKTAQSKVVVRAVRVPRGAAGYGRAVIDYMEADNAQPAALTMSPLAPEYPIGELT